MRRQSMNHHACMWVCVMVLSLSGCTSFEKGIQDGIADGVSAALSAFIEAPMVHLLEQFMGVN